MVASSAPHPRRGQRGGSGSFGQVVRLETQNDIENRTDPYLEQWGAAQGEKETDEGDDRFLASRAEKENCNDHDDSVGDIFRRATKSAYSTSSRRTRDIEVTVPEGGKQLGGGEGVDPAASPPSTNVSNKPEETRSKGRENNEVSDRRSARSGIAGNALPTLVDEERGGGTKSNVFGRFWRNPVPGKVRVGDGVGSTSSPQQEREGEKKKSTAMKMIGALRARLPLSKLKIVVGKTHGFILFELFFCFSSFSFRVPIVQRVTQMISRCVLVLPVTTSKISSIPCQLIGLEIP